MNENTGIEVFVILVETTGSANIGAVARSASAFGVNKIRLVAPKCKIDGKSRMWACYGKELLEEIAFFDDLPSALADLDMGAAFTWQDGRARHRHHLMPMFAEEFVPSLPPGTRLGLVFGNEQSGLANHHIKGCRLSVEIPVVAPHGSLNLAHAVSIALYEIQARARKAPIGRRENKHRQKANAHRLRQLYEECRESLVQVDYPSHNAQQNEELVKLQTIINRCGLENWEVRTLLAMAKEVRQGLRAEGL